MTHCATHRIPLPSPNPRLFQSQLTPLPDTSILDWLFDNGSLTGRLIHLTNDAFSVTPLFEGWQPLRTDECAALGLAEEAVRAGCARCTCVVTGKPWCLPAASRRAARCRATACTWTSWAAAPGRTAVLRSCLPAPCHLRFATTRKSGCQAECGRPGWARRSRFDRGALSVLVAEIFLPTLWSAARVHPENC